MIQLERVSKRFSRRLAVDNVTLSVPRGVIYGLLGHNGAGKSTAIGMMLGQVWPTSGTVRVCGHDVSANRTQALRKVGAIFETPAFYEYLSGRRNLEILCSYTGPVSAARMREVIDWVGLTGREHAPVRTYSHGMRARLALAQSLLPGPELLILDEPSDGLDPSGIHEMRRIILRLKAELGLTILLSSHFLNEVEQLCGRIAVLKDGQLVFEGELSQTRAATSWVRLRTGNFQKAVAVLRRAGLITADREDALICLADGVESDQVVSQLVETGMAVYEIAHQEETLESFYLRLMNGASNALSPTELIAQK